MMAPTVRVGCILLVLGASTFAGLNLNDQPAAVNQGTIYVPGSGPSYEAMFLPAAPTELRISSPPVFNITVRIVRDQDAQASLDGSEATLLLATDLHGPGTVAVTPPERGAYLIVFENHDPKPVSIVVSQRASPVPDPNAERLAEGTMLGGALLVAVGLGRSMRARAKPGVPPREKDP